MHTVFHRILTKLHTIAQREVRGDPSTPPAVTLPMEC
jgi:hypothetical protein